MNYFVVQFIILQIQSERFIKGTIISSILYNFSNIFISDPKNQIMIPLTSKVKQYSFHHDDSIPSGNQQINQRINCKFNANIISKNLISINCDGFDDIQQMHIDTNRNLSAQNEPQKVNGFINKRKSRSNKINLQPISRMGNQSIVTVYENKISQRQLKSDKQMPKYQNKTNEQQFNNASNASQKYDKEKKVSNKKNKQEQQQQFQYHDRQMYIHTITNQQNSNNNKFKQGQLEDTITNIDRKTSNLIFEDNDEQPFQDIEMNHIQIPKSRMTSILNQLAFQEEEEQSQLDENKSTCQEQIDSMEYFRSQVFFKKMLVKQLPKGKKVKLSVVRDRSGFNNIWPQYRLNFLERNLLIAAKTTSITNPTITFSLSSTNYQQNSQFYLGKSKQSIKGLFTNIYGEGYNPQNALQKNVIPRQLLATIVEQFLQQNKPRQFKIYIKKPEYNYYCNFDQVLIYKQEIPLHILYQYPQNKSKIIVCRNRKPMLNQQKKSYYLDFQLPNIVSSIKNFILEDEQGQNVMVFGKTSQRQFSMDISYPLSPFLGMALALTSFSSKSK